MRDYEKSHHHTLSVSNHKLYVSQPSLLHSADNPETTQTLKIAKNAFLRRNAAATTAQREIILLTFGVTCTIIAYPSHYCHSTFIYAASICLTSPHRAPPQPKQFVIQSDPRLLGTRTPNACIVPILKSSDYYLSTMSRTCCCWSLKSILLTLLLFYHLMTAWDSFTITNYQNIKDC